LFTPRPRAAGRFDSCELGTRAQGVRYQPGWTLCTAATIKEFIEVFIGDWAY
jgi:hypothetical protein